MIAEQNKLIEELKEEIGRMKRREEGVRTVSRTGNGQRYANPIDAFERESVRLTQAKITEETLALQQGLRRHRESRPIPQAKAPVQERYESLE